jgi:hypothetical protein
MRRSLENGSYGSYYLLGPALVQWISKNYRKTRKSDSNYTLRTPLVFYGNKYKGRESTDV